MQKFIPLAALLLLLFANFVAAQVEPWIVAFSHTLNPQTLAPSNVYRALLDDESLDLNTRQIFALEKGHAQALFVEGETAEAKRLLDDLYEQEKEFNRADITPQNVSAEPTPAVLKKLRKQRMESEKADEWQPGPGSWKPGDPIPEAFQQPQQERNSRRQFPRGESE